MLTSRLAPASLPPDLRVYAIGDVHGCEDRLAALHRDIAADLAARPIADARLIHLGDYIDRGADSAGVIERLIRGPRLAGLRVHNLMGNHEHMLLAALHSPDPGAAQLWLRNGGDATLRRWGVGAAPLDPQWRDRLPAAHLAWLRALSLSERLGGYVFVHAGLRPGTTLGAQRPDDLMWIREPFLSWPERFEAVVVHGHTPVEQPVLRANRIGIDTGAVLGGRLTCLVLEADRLGFLAR